MQQLVTLPLCQAVLRDSEIGFTELMRIGFNDIATVFVYSQFSLAFAHLVLDHFVP